MTVGLRWVPQRGDWYSSVNKLVKINCFTSCTYVLCCRRHFVGIETKYP